jgi:hypothetical protein
MALLDGIYREVPEKENEQLAASNAPAPSKGVGGWLICIRTTIIQQAVDSRAMAVKGTSCGMFFPIMGRSRGDYILTSS